MRQLVWLPVAFMAVGVVVVFAVAMSPGQRAVRRWKRQQKTKRRERRNREPQIGQHEEW